MDETEENDRHLTSPTLCEAVIHVGGGQRQLESPAERTQGDFGAPSHEGCLGAPLSENCAPLASGGQQLVVLPVTSAPNSFSPPTETNEDDEVVDGLRQTRVTDYFKCRPKKAAEKHPDDIDQVENAAVLCGVCDKSFETKKDAEEHFAKHGNNETIISLMRKIHDQGEMFKRAVKEHKEQVAGLQHQVHVLKTTLSKMRIQETAPPIRQTCPTRPSPPRQTSIA